MLAASKYPGSNGLHFRWYPPFTSDENPTIAHFLMDVLAGFGGTVIVHHILTLGGVLS